MKRPIAVDLFSGAGGMSLGFERAGFDVAVAVDADPYHCSVHERNFPYGKTLCTSIKDLSGHQILAIVGRKVDLLFGGPPCQGFSNMGVRDYGDSRNDLVGEFVRIAEEIEPTCIVIENVPGMVAGRTRTYLDDAIERLEVAGYIITNPVITMNARDFGVPQDRERLFVLATRHEKAIEYPKKSPPGHPARPTVGDALRDLPDVDDHTESTKVDSWPYSSEPESDYAAYARGQLVPSSDRSRLRLWNETLCSGSCRPRHGETARSLYRATAPGQLVPGHKLPKLNPDGLAPTLRAGTDSKRGSYTAPRPVHPFRPRCITWREAARLHGYPDWFSFYPGLFHSYRQIGNSVCPPVAHAVGLAVFSHLFGKSRVTRGSPIELGPVIKVSNGSGKNEKRRVHRVELEKVLVYLLSSLDRRKRVLRVTPDDIAAAVLKSDADLPRVAPERFAATVARSRSVKAIMKPLEEVGWTIRWPFSDDGSFDLVRLGSGAAISDLRAVKVSSRELQHALELDILGPLPDTKEALVEIGSNFVGDLEHLGQQDLFGDVPSYVTDHPVIDHDSILKWMRKNSTESGLIVSRLSEQHLLVGVARLCNDQIVLTSKTVLKTMDTKGFTSTTTTTKDTEGSR